MGDLDASFQASQAHVLLLLVTHLWRGSINISLGRKESLAMPTTSSNEQVTFPSGCEVHLRAGCQVML